MRNKRLSAARWFAAVACVAAIQSVASAGVWTLTGEAQLYEKSGGTPVGTPIHLAGSPALDRAQNWQILPDGTASEFGALTFATPDNWEFYFPGGTLRLGAPSGQWEISIASGARYRQHPDGTKGANNGETDTRTGRMIPGVNIGLGQGVGGVAFPLDGFAFTSDDNLLELRFLPSAELRIIPEPASGGIAVFALAALHRRPSRRMR